MSGKSSAVFSLSVATANQAGGDPDLVTLLPQPEIGAYKGMAVTNGAIDSFNFEEASHAGEGYSRSTPGGMSLAAVGVKNTTGLEKFGTPNNQFFRTGYPDAVTVSHRFRGCDGENPTTEGFGKILGSSMGLYEPTHGEVILNDDSPDAGTLIIHSDDASKLPVGAPFRVKRSGELTHEYGIVTSAIDDGLGQVTLTVHPELTQQLFNGATVNPCYAFYPIVGADFAKLLDFHARFDMGGTGNSATVRTVASGCRASGFTISNDEGGAVIEMSFAPLVVLQDDANANVVSDAGECPGALFQHRYGARVDLSGPVGNSTGGLSATRAYLPNLDHTISVEFETAPGTPETRSVMRGGSHEIHNSTCTVTLQTEKDSDLQQMLVKDELRSLILGFGPSGSTDGGCFFLKNGGRDSGAAGVSAGDGSRIQQETVLRAVSDFSGCDTSGLDAEGKRLATAPFLLVLPRKV